MKKNSYSWLLKDYEKMFKDKTGSTFTKEEAEFLNNYFDTRSSFAPGKHLYYLSIFRLKRFYPRFIVYFLIKKTLNNDFAKAGFQSLVSTNADFAKYMLNDVIKAYCKFSD